MTLTTNWAETQQILRNEVRPVTSACTCARRSFGSFAIYTCIVRQLKNWSHYAEALSDRSPRWVYERCQKQLWTPLYEWLCRLIMPRLKWYWYLSQAQASLHIRAVSPEPSLFAHMKYGFDQDQISNPTGWLRTRVWRMSLRRTKTTIILMTWLILWLKR